MKPLCNTCLASPVCINTLKNGNGITYKGHNCKAVQLAIKKFTVHSVSGKGKAKHNPARNNRTADNKLTKG
jgi:hypothetical protein